jgi:non-heme chloroperoxidase
VSVLVAQGDQDRILPISATGMRLPARIKDVRLEVIEGGPHAIGWTHAEEVNRSALDFPGGDS